MDDNSPCRIACFSDTFGAQSNNGVGRFLDYIQRLCSSHQIPFRLVIAGKDKPAGNLLPVKAPSFGLPVYSKIQFSMPLEHHRRNLKRRLGEFLPTVFHVSTPGPFGCLGLSMALEKRIPIVGIYHTDFPHYAYELVRQKIGDIKANPWSLASGVSTQWLTTFGNWMSRLEQGNPNLAEDIEALQDIFKRNAAVFSDDKGIEERVCEAAAAITARTLQKFYSRFSIVIARSPAHQHALIKQLKIDPDKVRLLRPGTDTKRFHPSHADAEIFREMNIPSDAIKVVYVGRVTPEKNMDLLVEVWEKVIARGGANKPHLIVAGYGSEREIKRLEALENTHLMGPQNSSTLSRVYASGDIHLMPSITETLGQVGLEAGASGTLTLAANVGGQTAYIRDGETGFLLDPNDSDAWASQLLELCKSRDRIRAMGAAARENVGDRYSIEASFQSYVDIHEEAVFLTSRQKRIAKNSALARKRQKQLPPMDVEVGGVMLISDYHAGRKFGSSKNRKLKHQALRSMLQFARDNDLDVVLGGDFGDHGSKQQLLDKDFEGLRSIFEEVLPDQVPVFIRGNHDYGYTDEQLEKLIGKCQVHSSLVYFHEPARVLITHGHILGLSRTVEAVEQASSYPEVESMLTEKALDNELKPSVIAYDFANLIESFMQKKGLSGLGIFWESLFSYRSELAEKIMKWSQQNPQNDQKTWKLISSLLGAHDDIATARKLSIACGSWATLFGHTHEPMAKRFGGMLESGQKSVQVIGNAGNVNRKRPTCVVAKFPCVSVYEFDPRENGLKQRSSARLREIDALRYSTKFKPNRARRILSPVELPLEENEHTTNYDGQTN